MARGIKAANPDVAAQVSELVRNRATHLGFTQQSLASEADVSAASLRKLWQPSGQPLSIGVLGDISHALGWPRGALGRLLDGEDPDEVLPSTHSAQPHTVAATVRVPSPTVTAVPDGVAFASELPDWEQWSPEEKQGVLDAVQLVMRGAAEKHRRRSTN